MSFYRGKKTSAAIHFCDLTVRVLNRVAVLHRQYGEGTSHGPAAGRNGVRTATGRGP